MAEQQSLLNDEQRAFAQSIFDGHVAHFRKVEESYRLNLRTIMNEAERRASLGLDYRDHIREELAKWADMFAVASRQVDNSAALIGADGKAVWSRTLTEVGQFIKEALGDLDKAERREADHAYFSAVEAKGEQMVAFAKLAENLRRMRHY